MLTSRSLRLVYGSPKAPLDVGDLARKCDCRSGMLGITSVLKAELCCWEVLGRKLWRLSLEIETPLAAANLICSQGGVALLRRFSVLETENLSGQSQREGQSRRLSSVMERITGK